MRYLGALLLFPVTLAWNVLLGRMLGFRPWWNRVDEHVWIGALPFPSDAKKLHDRGVRAVVNTCREYAGPVREYEKYGMEQLRLPTVDFQPPSLEDCRRGVAFMQRHISQGEGVYVHCKAGRGRSATIVVCWLMAAKGLTPAESQAFLLKKRRHVHRRLDQRRVVQEFWNELQTKKAGDDNH